MADVFLLGGGWDAGAVAATYGRFVAAAGPAPNIVAVLVAEAGYEQYFAQFAGVLMTAGAATVEPVFVGPERALRMADLAGADGVFVGGGLTPGYSDALAGVRPTLRSWLDEHDVPYAGFSAGAAVAADVAIIGGWQVPAREGFIPACPEEVSEDLAAVTLSEGLGLVPFAVDVHASTWGTLSRLVSVVESGQATQGWAIDEDTMLAVQGGTITVHGTGRAYHVCTTAAGVTVEIVAAVPAPVPA